MTDRPWTPVLKSATEDAALNDGEHRLYCILAGYCWQGADTCWPTQATLARQLSVSERTIWERLQGLEAKGYITQRRRGKGRANEIELHHIASYRWPEPDSQDPAGEILRTEEDAGREEDTTASHVEKRGRSSSTLEKGAREPRLKVVAA